MAGELLWALFFGVLATVIGVIQIWQNRRKYKARAQSRGVYTTVAWTESERRSYFTVSRDANATRESSWVIWGWYRARFGARMYSIRSGDYETTAARAGGGYAVELCP
ncbi:hypothetical protein PV05_10855 [Exophiala xenobiotica]|uniref:Uncharacterized protein n=1 Tax=Exophiala xenobiotica TaxID=348802 RepID=A0A0D2BA99_9EURO|nr:uncharacterized protein PV05_10855 [Exophiala xenobiotica]KIW49151.1 hypothetical protein PV05_10855 [Exophiala xenobiotica]